MKCSVKGCKNHTINDTTVMCQECTKIASVLDYILEVKYHIVPGVDKPPITIDFGNSTQSITVTSMPPDVVKITTDEGKITTNEDVDAVEDEGLKVTGNKKGGKS